MKKEVFFLADLLLFFVLFFSGTCSSSCPFVDCNGHDAIFPASEDFFSPPFPGK